MAASIINAQASQLFEAWGGLRKAAPCFPELSNQLR